MRVGDVGAVVSPGGPVDREANRRGETLYGADGKIPLHPKALSEDMASLLPGELRPALLWPIDLDATGEGIAVDVPRARGKSRAQLDYAGVPTGLVAGAAHTKFDVLSTAGERGGEGGGG